MNTCFTCVFSSNRSPLVTTRFAIFPLSIEPTRLSAPAIFAALIVSARSAASGGRPSPVARARPPFPVPPRDVADETPRRSNAGRREREYHPGFVERRRHLRRVGALAE